MFNLGLTRTSPARLSFVLKVPLCRLHCGRFPFTKNVGKFLLGIFVWEKRVQLVTSPIRSQAPLCRFSESPANIHGTCDKDEKSVRLSEKSFVVSRSLAAHCDRRVHGSWGILRLEKSFSSRKSLCVSLRKIAFSNTL